MCICNFIYLQKNILRLVYSLKNRSGEYTRITLSVQPSLMSDSLSMNRKFWSVAAGLSYFTCVFLWAQTLNLWGNNWIFTWQIIFHMCLQRDKTFLPVQKLFTLWTWSESMICSRKFDLCCNFRTVRSGLSYVSCVFLVQNMFPSVQRFLCPRPERSAGGI